MHENAVLLRRFFCIPALTCALFVLVLTGCDQCDKNQKNMNQELANILGEKRRNCNQMVNAEARAQCHEGVDNYEACARSCIARWKAACDINDQTKMNEIKEECYTGPTPCDENWTPTVDVNGLVANFWTPFNDGDLITLELQPRNVVVADQLQHNDRAGRGGGSNVRKASRNQILMGSFAFETSEATIAGSASGRISWVPSNAILTDESSRAYTPTEVSLTLNTLAGAVSLELLDYNKNEIRIGDDGTGRLNALFSVELAETIPSAMVHPVLWLEVPVAMDRRGISFAAYETPSAEIAPVAPNAWADWRRDFVVDLEDYYGFFADFASGEADANGDGVTDDRDAELFLEFFYDEMGR